MLVGPGDRVFAGPESLGEFQVGSVRAYFSAHTDLSLVDYNGQTIEYGQASGSVNYFANGFYPGQSLFVSTPNGGIVSTRYSKFRVDVHPDLGWSQVTNGSDSPAITISGAGGFSVTLLANQAVQIYGTNPVEGQPVPPLPGDEFQSWSYNLETHRQQSPSAQYVNTEMEGYAELDNAGEWQAQSQYGPIWFPRVEAGWAPYHNGHWVHRPFFGWTWVADEPWGAAPFHYGRWVAIGGRWAWIPGPREGHPVWSPAQVVFAGGISVGGVGVSVWFPLGPGEAYKPWYPCTPEYINRINISNIRPAPAVHVQVNYVTIVNQTTNITYINHTTVTAMNTSDFAAGRPATKVAVNVNVNLVEHVQPAAPAAPPPAKVVILHPAPKPQGVEAARPVLINHEGKAVSTVPGAKPAAVPIKALPPKPAPPAVKPMATPAKPEAAPAKPEAKPMAAPAKPEAKPMATPAKPEMTPVKPEAKPAAKPEAAPAKPEAAPAKPEPKPEATPAKPAVKPEATPPAKDPKKKDEKKDEKKTPPPPPSF